MTNIKAHDDRRLPNWISYCRVITFDGLELDTKFCTELEIAKGIRGESPKLTKKNTRWPPAAIMDFGFKVLNSERLELATSNLAQS